MKLAVFATHPVQYHVPLWRRLAKISGTDLRVFYFSDHSVRGGTDPGFQVPVAWDVPLLAGYESEFLSRDADLARPERIRVRDAEGLMRPFDAVLLIGYIHGFERQIVKAASDLGRRAVLRAELADHGPRPLWKRPFRWAFLKWFYSKIDAFAVIGKAARRHLVERGVPEERMFFSPYAVDGELMETQRREWTRESARRALGIPPNAFVVLFSGKLIDRKDPLALVRAMGRKPAGDRGWLLMVGEGPLRFDVEKLGRDLLPDRLLLPGFVNQSALGRYFAAADVFALPSRFETWGLVVNEAMHFGLPVIVSNQVGCQEDLVIPGRTGWVHSLDGEEGLLEALRSAAGNPASLAAMGRSASEQVAQYSVENAARGVAAALGLNGT